MRIGFIGVGAIARRHAAALQKIEGAAVVAHLGAREGSAAAAAAAWGGEAHADLDSFVRTGRPDCVFVTPPPDAHGAIERRLIDDGIPFLVEKPLSADRRTAEEIGERLFARPLATAVGYHWRALDFLDDVRAFLSERPPRLVLGEYLAGTPATSWWRKQARSGGQFVEQACHLVDLARALAGEARVESAAAHAFDRPSFPDADIAGATAAILRHVNGAVGVITCTCLQPSRESHSVNLRIVCDGGAVTVSLTGVTIDSADGRREIAVRDNPYELQARAFLSAVESSRPERVFCTYADALNTHRLCHDVLDAAAKT